MCMLLFLMVNICESYSVSKDLVSLLRKFDFLIENKIGKNMLDSPDHCESSLASTSGTLNTGDSSAKDRSKRSSNTRKDSKASKNLGSNTSESSAGEREFSKNTKPVNHREKFYGQNSFPPDLQKDSSEDVDRENNALDKSLEYESILKTHASENYDDVESRSKENFQKQAGELNDKRGSLDGMKELERGGHIKHSDWRPRKKKRVVPGQPRKVKVVKIVPVPVDDDGGSWSQNNSESNIKDIR